jgi:hypothetical protein
MMAAGSPVSQRNGRATLTRPGTVLQAASATNSTATDAAGIVTDFNGLLAKLRAAGILAS